MTVLAVALSLFPGATAAQLIPPEGWSPAPTFSTPQLFAVQVPSPRGSSEELPVPSDYGRAVLKGAAWGGGIGLGFGLLLMPTHDNSIFSPVGLLVATTVTGVAAGAGLATLGYLAPQR